MSQTRIKFQELPLRATKLSDVEMGNLFGGAYPGCPCGNDCDCQPGYSCQGGKCVIVPGSGGAFAGNPGSGLGVLL